MCVVNLAAALDARPWRLPLPGELRWVDGAERGVRAGNSPFRFRPAESTKFSVPPRWRKIEWGSQFHEGLRLKRGFPMARLVHFIHRFMGMKRRAEFMRFSGIALLERAKPPGT